MGAAITAHPNSAGHGADIVSGHSLSSHCLWIHQSVTPEKVRESLTNYQNPVNTRGAMEDDAFPLSVNIAQIVPIRPLLKALPELYADPLTGIGADLMEIDPVDVAQTYYQRCMVHLADVMKNQQRNHPAAQKQAAAQ